jgi:IS30 family transposase
MHTNKNLTPMTREFRRWAKGELAAQGQTVTGIARHIGKSRNAVSRAINRGEFLGVQKQIRKALAA